MSSIRTPQLLTQKHRESAAKILDIVWKAYDIKPSDLIHPPHRRTSRIARARHMAMWIVYHELDLSLLNVAEVFETGLGSIQFGVKAVNEDCNGNLDEALKRTEIRGEIKRTLAEAEFLEKCF